MEKHTENSRAELHVDSRVGNRGNVDSHRDSQFFQIFEPGTVSKNGKVKIYKKLKNYNEVINELKNSDCNFICCGEKIFPKSFVNMWNDRTIDKKLHLLYSIRPINFQEKSLNFFNFFNFFNFLKFSGIVKFRGFSKLVKSEDNYARKL